jgi:hypothetical protein
MEIVVAIAAIPILLCARFQWMAWLEPEFRTLFKLAGGLTILALCFTTTCDALRALPLVWLVAVPGMTSRRDLESRTLLALLVVLQSLHAYPVAGSQVGFCAFLLPAVGTVTVWDSFNDLPMHWRAVSCRARWKFLGTTAVVLILVCFHSTISSVPSLTRQFREGDPLTLTGAESIRFPERAVAELVWVTKNLEHHGDTFVGMPGLHSFYVWSSLSPPVPFYAHTWVLFYDDSKQEKLVQALLASKRPCMVRNRKVIKFWTGARELKDGPLVHAAESEFQFAGAVGDYELLIPNSARPDLVLSVLSAHPPQRLLDRFMTDRALRLAFPVMGGVHVARIVVRDTQRNVDVFDSASSSPEKHVSIVNADGDSLLRAGSPDFIDLSVRSDIFMLYSPSSFQANSESTLVRAYDEKDRVVARLLVPAGAPTQ